MKKTQQTSYARNEMYNETKTDSVIDIDHIIGIGVDEEHPKEKKNDLLFHNFWVLIYCERGSCNWTVDNTICNMEAGTFVIVPPNTVRIYNDSNPDTITVYTSFRCNSSILLNVQKQMLTATEEQKTAMSSIIADFSSHFTRDVTGRGWLLNDETTDCDLQRIKCKIEMLLLDIYQNCIPNKDVLYLENKNDNYDERYETVIAFLNENLTKPLTINDIVKGTGIGKNSLEKIFKYKESDGVMHYFTRMKIDKARVLISEKKYSITTIAEMLGFTSIHNFSKVFKREMMGISPKKYESLFVQ